jgi:O-acetyl-ADP-ribose deacetylase (regulator of RNase III)
MKVTFQKAYLEKTMIKFNLVVGALGDQKADAIVTAATRNLIPLSDYYAEALEKAGPELSLDILENNYSCEVGDALVTSAFNLDADVIVHAVTPDLDADEANSTSLLATYANAIIMGYEEGDARTFVVPPLGLESKTQHLKGMATLAYDGLFLGIGQCPGIKEVTLCMPNEAIAPVFEHVFKTELEKGWFFGPSCPNCGKPALPITYGLPTERDFMDPNFYSGGCIIWEESPDWACRACEAEF